MAEALSTKQWIERVETKFPNEYTFKGTKYLGMAYPIKLQCKKHGELTFMRAQAVLNKNNKPCRFCNGILPEFEFTRKWLQKWMKYDEKTGELTIRATGQNKGYLGSNGYLYISFSGRELLVHRVIMMYKQGKIPMEVDHIDSNPLNNKWKNLRNADRTLQELNKKSRGVMETKEGKYIARITYEGKTKRSKRFDTYDEAKIVYEKYRKKLIKKHMKKIESDIV